MILHNLIHKFLLLIALCTVLATLYGCAHAETFGERARKVMADIDKECRERQLGPYEPEPRKTGIRNSSCDILFLKPYDPLATPEGRFAHSIKLPDEDKRKEVYRPGMTDEEYFKALCDAEVGEFIFRTVDNVEGIVQMRPFQKPPRGYRDLVFYTFESNSVNFDHAQYDFVQPYSGKYKFFEVALADSEKQRKKASYMYYYRDQNANPGKMVQSGKDGKWLQVPDMVASEPTETTKSLYGFISRGNRRSDDIERGISGSELIILDLKSSEVLAYRREFLQYYFDAKWYYPRQIPARSCPSYAYGTEFIKKVLRPIRQN